MTDTTKIKRCTTCTRWLDISLFGACKSFKDGKDTRCKPCVKEKNLAYYSRSPIRRDQSRQRAATRVATLELRQEYNQAMRSRRQDPTIAAQVRAACRKWQKTNSDKVNAAARFHFAYKLQRTPKWVDLKAIERFYIDAKALTHSTGVEHHVDHIVPLQGKTVSGLHVPWNLQLLPATENIKKGNRFWPDMWEVS